MTTEEQAPVPLERRHPPIWWVIQRFQLNIDALREMLEKIAPNIRELDKVRLGPNALAAINALPQENQERLRRFLEEEEAAERERSARPPSEEESEEGHADRDALGKRLYEIFRGDEFALTSFMDGYMRAIAGPSRIAIVQNSFLVMAVSAFEVLVSGLLAPTSLHFPERSIQARKSSLLKTLRGLELRGTPPTCCFHAA